MLIQAHIRRCSYVFESEGLWRAFVNLRVQSEMLQWPTETFERLFQSTTLLCLPELITLATLVDATAAPAFDNGWWDMKFLGLKGSIGKSPLVILGEVQQLIPKQIPAEVLQEALFDRDFTAWLLAADAWEEAGNNHAAARCRTIGALGTS